MQRNEELLDELAVLIQRHATGALKAAMPHVVLSVYTSPRQPVMYMAEPAFALVVKGAKQVVLGEQEFRYAKGQYLVYLVDLPLSSSVLQASAADPVLGLGFALKPDMIASLLLESRASSKERPERGIAVSDLSSDLLDPVVRLIRLFDQPEDIPILAKSIEREILWRLMNGEQGAMVRQLGLADSRTMQIGRAIKWIRGHYAEPIRTETLADVSGMSKTSLHRHFSAMTSMSPHQFQKQVRLQAARTLLLSSSRGAADIGMEVGYESASQFSREYRRLFGRAPSDDGAFLRGKPAHW